MFSKLEGLFPFWCEPKKRKVSGKGLKNALFPTRVGK